jgi:tripartite-type tricarboxylate transporter receptor subunit TctC
VNLPRRKFLRLAAGAAAFPAVSPIARAQSYPTRPVTMVVPFPAGGPSDTIMRIIIERMRSSLGQPIIIENIAGAAGSIRTGRVARAAGDGYMLIAGEWGSHVVNGAVYALPYDVVSDFEPVALLTSNPSMIITKKSMPANDLKGFIAWLKANPDTATFGTNGIGGASHIYGLLFQQMTGTRFRFVPYRGLGQTMVDLVAGQIDAVIGGVADSLPQIRAGDINCED